MNLGKYDWAIGYAVSKVRKSLFEGELEHGELRALALEVAFERHELWESGEVQTPGTDCKQKLHQAVRDLRYERGWRQRGSGKSRRWVRVDSPRGIYEGELPDGAYYLLGPSPYEDDGVYPLRSEWPAFSKTQRRKFARLFEANYPEAAAAFLALYEQPKPRNRTVLEWASRKERARLKLLGLYADELVSTMLLVTAPRAISRRRAA